MKGTLEDWEYGTWPVRTRDNVSRPKSKIRKDPRDNPVGFLVEKFIVTFGSKGWFCDTDDDIIITHTVMSGIGSSRVWDIQHKLNELVRLGVLKGPRLIDPLMWGKNHTVKVLYGRNKVSYVNGIWSDVVKCKFKSKSKDLPASTSKNSILWELKRLSCRQGWPPNTSSKKDKRNLKITANNCGWNGIGYILLRDGKPFQELAKKYGYDVKDGYAYKADHDICKVCGFRMIIDMYGVIEHPKSECNANVVESVMSG